MKRALVDEAIDQAGRGPRRAELRAAIDRSLAAGASLFEALLATGIDPDVVVGAASAVTGLPPAPRLLVNNPQVPEVLDATGIRDAGGVPIGTVQGRLWIAFSDPDAARAAVFSDDVVVCLGLPDDLERARVAFDRLHPPDDDPATLTLAALTPEQAQKHEQQRRVAQWDDATSQVAPLSSSSRLSPPTAVGAALGDASDEDLFDAPAATEAREGLRSTAIDPDGDTRVQRSPLPPEPTRAAPAPRSTTEAASRSTTEAASAEPERLRLLRLAQLGRLKQFSFVRPLGSGAMATVDLASHNGRNVAVKVLEPHLVHEPLALARFRREARALAALDHENVVATLDAGEGDGVCWLCCPWLDGGTLAELMRRTGAMPLGMALPIVGAVLAGLAHAHERGVLHRDLKPQNVLLSQAGDVQISDFGLAKLAGDAPLTRLGVRAGTPAYMAPEQARGEEVDERADLFSVGVLLLELVNGAHPFARATPQETMAAIANAEFEGSTGDARVDDVVAALLARERDARPPGARAVLARLAPLLERCAAVEAVVARALEDPAGAVAAAAFDAVPPTQHDEASSSTMAEPTQAQASPSTLYPHTITNLPIPVLPLAADALPPVPAAQPSTADVVRAGVGASPAVIVAVVAAGVVAAVVVVAAAVFVVGHFFG